MKLVALGTKGGGGGGLIPISLLSQRRPSSLDHPYMEVLASWDNLVGTYRRHVVDTPQ